MFLIFIYCQIKIFQKFSQKNKSIKNCFDVSLGIRSTAASPNYAQVDLAANLFLFEQCLKVISIRFFELLKKKILFLISILIKFLQPKSSVKFIIYVAMLHGELLRPTSPFFEAKERVVDALFAQRELPFVVLRPAPYQEDLADIMSAVDAVNRIFLF